MVVRRSADAVDEDEMEAARQRADRWTTTAAAAAAPPTDTSTTPPPAAEPLDVYQKSLSCLSCRCCAGLPR